MNKRKQNISEGITPESNRMKTNLYLTERIID
jgi:hypothetical protein